MSIWSEFVGHEAAVDALQRAAATVDPLDAAMTHSWLITGPPGSGRSNLAFAFAAALLSPPDHVDEATITQVEARTHPDLAVLSTDGVIINIDSAREAVKRSYYSPSVGRYRVVVVEDADRMVERTSNTLLKALEEPPERTVWILCAPSEADLLPTIRSRVRSVNLTVPEVSAVARLLTERDGVSPERALIAAQLAQSHIGMARKLATSDEAWNRRAKSLEIVLQIQTVGAAVLAAAALIDIASADAEAFTAERDDEERAEVLRQLGIAPGAAVPPAMRSHIRALEEGQKNRAKRGLRDGVDRILVDLMSLFRDVIVLQLDDEAELVNSHIAGQVRDLSESMRPEETIAMLDRITHARARIARNVPPLLALEAMLVRLATRGSTLV
ncbi:DNA polymerase III subunit delta' [Humidisolicoccus flavus]|uniref:DNA polymerase III subunit delta' n=1 Tax=Humidisolicoccus flavus TaxID=3111414 RepID=UPI00325167CC